MTEAPKDLLLVETDCWQRMVNGSNKGNHPFRTAVLGNAVAVKVYMRTVVIRNVDSIKKQVYFYTDTRSAKWKQLHHQPGSSLLFYDADEQIQIRLSGNTSLHQFDEMADKAWSETSIINRSNYLTDLAPSTISSAATDGLTTVKKNKNLSLAETEKARKNFGLVAIAVDWMEWLWLNREGHRRAEFDYANDGTFAANWLVP